MEAPPAEKSKKRARSPSKKKKRSKKRRKLEELQQSEVQDDEYSRSLFSNSNFYSLPLKTDHTTRPIWVCPNRLILLETFSPLYHQAYEFLIAIAEPISRLRTMHEYKLTDFSLYAAVSVGLSKEKILSVLDRLSKVIIPEPIIRYIDETTEAFGKVSMVLRENRYFLEAKNAVILAELQKDPVIRAAQVGTDFVRTEKKKVAVGHGTVDTSTTDYQGLDDDDGGFVPEESWAIEIDREKLESVKVRCIEKKRTALEEYDFANDTKNASIDIDLKPSTTLRPYQEKSLAKMFGNGRARSGVIVLPCGAGKTLVGVTAACTVRKQTFVCTTNSVSVLQWKAQFLQWSTIDEQSVTTFTSQSTKDEITDKTKIIITTYSMMSHSQKRSEAATAMLNKVQGQEWGMLILDEVHVAPANSFRKVVKICAAHCKLGLTATLVREDDKIQDLNFLIGSKLYEANWLDLSRAGYIASVSCAEVWCDMTAEFFREWICASNNSKQSCGKQQKSLYRKQKQFSIMNPNKFRICEFLIRYHEARGDKILVFSDDIFALQHYATTLKYHFLYGETSEKERNTTLDAFKYTNTCNTIFISRIGDNAIDLPDANVLIQISSHFAARRQEAQRLGRILRAKQKASNSEFNAYFYSLVSKYTEEMGYSKQRQSFLVNQGFSYRVITEIPEMENMDLHYSTKEEQIQLLGAVKHASCEKEKLNIHDKLKHIRVPGRASNLSGASGRSFSGIAVKHKTSALPKRSK